MALNAVFLSGWEYNRLVQEDPLTPRQSALPAEVLWNGAAQFWLFERVYCTKESLDGETAAGEILDWATGRIFQDLSHRGFLKVFEWNALREESPLRYQRVVRTHQSLRQEYDETAIRRFLEAGNDVALETIKIQLLAPILDHLHCVHNTSPNSIVRWMESPARSDVLASGISRALSRLREAVDKQGVPVRGGAELTDRPGTGLAQQELAKQREVEHRVQKPMIPDLLLGRLSQQDYMAALLPTAGVYVPGNQQLINDYERNIETLERLRDVAKRYLWRDLHEEWLPRLADDPGFLPEIEGLLRDALLRAHFDPYLKYLTFVGIAIVAGLMASVAGPVAGVATGGVLAAAHADVRNRTDNLTLFLQKSKDVVTRGDR